VEYVCVVVDVCVCVCVCARVCVCMYVCVCVGAQAVQFKGNNDIPGHERTPPRDTQHVGEPGRTVMGRECCSWDGVGGVLLVATWFRLPQTTEVL
jgi:hypothetical protein